MKDKEILEKLKEFVDELEGAYGELEGFEVKLNHPVVDGKTQEYGDIKSFVLYYITKEEIIDKLEKS